MTNGDKIRQMDNEELAKYLTPAYCVDCPFKGKSYCKKYPPAARCYDSILKWLEEEVKDDE